MPSERALLRASRQIPDWTCHFTYRSDGVLLHNERPGTERLTLLWNKRWANQPTRTVIHGYRSVNVGRLPYKCARIIWEMHNGPIPFGCVIDHANGDTLDDRIENLRCATRMENCRNRAIGRNNTSGLKGVSKHGKKWRAMISIGTGKQKQLGTFRCPTAAHFAYIAAAKINHGEFARFQ